MLLCNFSYTVKKKDFIVLCGANKLHFAHMHEQQVSGNLQKGTMTVIDTDVLRYNTLDKRINDKGDLV